jgi:hypothetical protein
MEQKAGFQGGSRANDHAALTCEDEVYRLKPCL